MGRKKKVTIETPKEQPKETQQKTTRQNSSASIGYQGKLNVQVRRGDKVLSNKTYHNTGNINLFRFLCQCLAGNYREDLRPYKIALFARGNTETEYFDNVDTWEFNKGNLATPLMISYSNTPITRYSRTELGETVGGSYDIEYEFKIPYTYITKSFCKAAIYSYSATVDEIVEPHADDYSWSAAFGFANAANTDFQQIDLKNADRQFYTMVLTWTMTISNQTVAITTIEPEPEENNNENNPNEGGND